MFKFTAVFTLIGSEIYEFAALSLSVRLKSICNKFSLLVPIPFDWPSL